MVIGGRLMRHHRTALYIVNGVIGDDDLLLSGADTGDVSLRFNAYLSSRTPCLAVDFRLSDELQVASSCRFRKGSNLQRCRVLEFT